MATPEPRRPNPEALPIPPVRQRIRSWESVSGTRPPAAREREPQEELVTGSLWMVGLSLALFFIPPFNGLIGGLVGGYKAGSLRRGLLAALLPAFVVAVGLWFILGMLGLPVVGLIAGVAAGGWVVLSEFGLFVGAMLGGAIGGVTRNESTRRPRIPPGDV